MVSFIYRSALADRPHVAETSTANRLRESVHHVILNLRGRETVVEAALSASGFGMPAMLTRAYGKSGRVLRLGPDEWLLFVGHAQASSTVTTLQSKLGGESHALVDISERIGSMNLDGPSSELILAVACPLDLHTSVAPAEFASRTVFGKAEIILERGSTADTFMVHTNRSFAPYVWQLLLEGGREFQLAPA